MNTGLEGIVTVADFARRVLGLGALVQRDDGSWLVTQ